MQESKEYILIRGEMNKKTHMKFILKLPLGFHIPFEDCERCESRCSNYRKNERENEVLNIRRKKLAEYFKQLQISTHIYNSTPDMFENLDFNYCFMHNADSYGLLNDILLIDHTDKKLIFVTIERNREIEWYNELNKSGKIHDILDLRFG